MILHKSQMPLLTKLGLSVFLCLSIFMVVCNIIRASWRDYQGLLDAPWQSTWSIIEGCVAVTMASLTAYRSTLFGSSDSPSKLASYLRRIFGRDLEAGSEPLGPREIGESPFSPIRIRFPKPVLTGVRRIFDIKTTRTDMTMTGRTQDFEMESIRTEYHEHIKMMPSRDAV